MKKKKRKEKIPINISSLIPACDCPFLCDCGKATPPVFNKQIQWGLIAFLQYKALC